MGATKRSWWGERISTVVRDYFDGRAWSYAHKKKDDMPDVMDGHCHDAMVDARLSQVAAPAMFIGAFGASHEK